MSTEGRFTKVNEGFTCLFCGRDVPPAPQTCRDHCVWCLHSLHVDINPGDRANPCRGLLKPIGYENTGHKGLMIQYRCEKCGEHHRNRTAPDDDYDAILKLQGSYKIP